MDTQHSENGKNPIQQLQQKPARGEFLIIGIGASAGGIRALQEFFRQVPEDSGMAYVVILHLSPDHDSHLAGVLQRETKLTVKQVTEKVHIIPNTIYVVPPNQHLTMEDGFLAVSPNIVMEERRAPVDIFFRTLADEHGPRAIAVILSGTGANGSMGLKRIKERGGACFVQNPREAEFNEMPRNAIATEMVDEVLPVTKIPAKIIAYKTSLGSVQITEEAEMRPEEQQQALREIFTQIRVRTGHDFSNYKRPTLLRRVERRINIRNLPDLPAYARYLQENPEEVLSLLKDLLISVTNFFRDKKAFDVLEQEIMPVIFKSKTSNNQVRIWVAACATGEEAYSIAIMCAEKTIGAIDMPRVQIFATDIDESAIAQAREGLYSLNDTADVSPERLRRFFNKEGDNFRIRREIREMIMFAHHNFLKDPPFSHLDLVSCRNVMIYLNAVAQERVMETFHFALNPGGYLFLGTSESVDGASDLYASYNRENHIFQSRQVSQRSYPVPESTPSLYFDKFKKDYAAQQSENKILERISFGDLHQQLLEEYASPSLVVNEEYDILHLTERAGRYLQIGGGELSQNLLKLVKPELRLELRSALYQAVQRQSAVKIKGLQVNIDDITETINLHVSPVLRSGDTAKGFILVLFEPSGDGDKQEILLSADEPVARQLEEELVKVKSQLRAANEQHDFQAEEMKASNEELQAMNEELRSTAEELETSKEELQSINEELRTVNQELKIKIEETSIASNNFQNLINSTDIGTIFLDRSFRVAMFTPAARNIFNLIPADYGRPLTDITYKLEHDGFLADAETVLEKLTSIEKEVRSKEGKIYLMRLLPYRTAEDHINGVVLTFVDITQRKKADEAVRISEEKYRTLFETIDEGFAIMELVRDEQGQVVDIIYREVNEAFMRHTGLGDVTGKTSRETIPNYDTNRFKLYQHISDTGETSLTEFYVSDLNRWFRAHHSRLGEVDSPFIVAVFDEITERKRREVNLAFLAEVSEDLVQMTSSEATLEILGAKIGAHFNSNRCSFVEIYENEDKAIVREWHRPELPDIAGGGPLSQFLGEPYRQKSRTGETIVIPDAHQSSLVDGLQLEKVFGVVSLINIPLVRNGQWVFTLGVHDAVPRNWRADEIELLQELTARIWARLEKVRAEEALSKSEEKYRTLFNSMDEGFAVIELILDGNGKPVDTFYLEANPAYGRHTGLHNIVGKRALEVMPSIGEWLNFYGNIARTGEAMRLEYYVDHIDRWLTCYVSRIGGEGSLRLAVVFNDITERKQREQQQEYLLKLSDAIRSTKDAVSIEEAVTKTALDYFRADRCYYCTIEKDVVFVKRDAFRSDLPSASGIYPLHSFPLFKKAIDEGRPRIVHNAHTTEILDEGLREIVIGLQIISYIMIPVVKHGKTIGLFCLVQSTPRSWMETEVRLAEETAERAWVAIERANAEERLRRSEERLQLANEAADVGTFIYYPADDRGEPDAKMLALYGLPQDGILNLSEALNRIIHPDDRGRYANEVAQALNPEGNGKLDADIRIIHPDGSVHWMNVTAQTIFEERKVIRMPGVSIDITGRKKAEEALLKSEQRLQRMVNIPQVGVLTFDHNDNMLYANDAFLEMVGYSREEFDLGKFTWRDFTPVEHLESSLHVMEQLEKTGVGGPYEKEYYRKDGTKIWMMFVAADMGDGTLVEYAVDISERKRAEEAVRESEKRLQKALQIETVGVIFFNDDGDILETNHAFQEMSGYTSLQIKSLRLNLRKITPPEWIPAVQKAMHELMSRGIATPYEKELLRSDGSRWWGLCAKARISGNENIEYVINVTKHKEAEAALHQSEERYRIALQSADMAAWDWNVVTDRVKWNDQHYYLLGLQPEETEKNADFFLQFVHEDDVERVTKTLMDSVEVTGLYQCEFRIVRADNKKVRWMSGYGRAYAKEGNRATRMIGVMYDVTERKLLEQQKEDFISIASHELKTPVTSIKAYAEVLHDMLQEADDMAGAGLMEKLDIQIDRLIDLIRALLDTSKIAQGELPLKPEKLDFKSLVTEHVTDLQRLSDNHNLVVKSSQEIIISADRERIGQVLTNLISNGIKYSPKGGSITIGWEILNDTLQVYVRDEGIGISQEAQERVFDRFFRETNVKMQTYPGMGLGLYITANIVHRHGGKIWVESQPGKGSVFHFTLPVNK